jgi:hypothetical protein
MAMRDSASSTIWCWQWFGFEKRGRRIAVFPCVPRGGNPPAAQ